MGDGARPEVHHTQLVNDPDQEEVKTYEEDQGMHQNMDWMLNSS